MYMDPDNIMHGFVKQQITEIAGGKDSFVVLTCLVSNTKTEFNYFFSDISNVLCLMYFPYLPLNLIFDVFVSVLYDLHGPPTF